MTDWLSGGEPLAGPAESAPPMTRGPKHVASGGSVWAVVALEVLLLTVGVGTLLAAPGMRLLGYVACGIALPLVWALLYVSLKRRDLVDDARTVWLERINRWLLVAGLVVGIWCAVLVALEWAK